MPTSCVKPARGAKTIAALLLSVLGFVSNNSASELKPLTPDFAQVLTPVAAPVQSDFDDEDGAGEGAVSRLGPSGPVDPDLPFSWPQVIVLREGEASQRYFGGFDPGFQQVQYTISPNTPTFVKVLSFDGQHGLMQLNALAKAGGNIETFVFHVTARGKTNDTPYTIAYDIRKRNTRVRGAPQLLHSPGDIIKPGQTVRYVWSATGRGEKRPKVEAVFAGQNGPSTGLSSSTITEVLALKARPVVLGHYLMTVTPRDVRGEPARGSISNGVVIRCAFGSENLPPVTDGFKADNFLPGVGETVTLQPVVVDPETGQSVFDNETYDFGDGVVASGASGAIAHVFNAPGIYGVRCTVPDDHGLMATAQDNMIVGASVIPEISFKVVKNIPPEEAGNGELQSDSVTAVFKNMTASAGDRIIFCYNRNRFGRTSASDASDDTDIVLKGGRTFTGTTRQARNLTVTASAAGITVTMDHAQFDRTGDPRLGRADVKGIFGNQRIALCVIPADGSTPRVQVYTGNIQIKLVGGDLNRGFYTAELNVKGQATTKLPNPKKQELDN